MKNPLLRRELLLGCCLLLLPALIGCGNTQSDVAKDTLHEMNRLLSAFKKIKKSEEISGQMSIVQEARQQFQYLKQRKDSLPPMSADEEARFREKYGKVMRDAQQQVESEATRVKAMAKDEAAEHRPTIDDTLQALRQLNADLVQVQDN